MTSNLSREGGQQSGRGLMSQNLGTLPLELLHRIITIGPCESALSLAQVNKRFNLICKSPLIYIQIIEDKLKYDPMVRNATHQPWNQLAGLSQESDYSIVARWALADSRARAASADNKLALANKPHELLRWEPHLLVVDHPEARAMCVRARAADLVPWFVTDQEEASRFAFMFAYSMMVLDVDCPGRSSNLPDTAAETENLLKQCWKRLEPLSLLPLDAASILKEPLPHHREAWITKNLANVALGWFSQHLNHSQRVANVQGPPWIEQLRLPSLSKMPLEQFIEVGHPFSSQLTFSVDTKLLDTSSLTSFLTQGEWVGYYCYSFQPHSFPVFDSMTSNINFECLDVPDADADFLRLTSRGKDSYGNFTVLGSISTTDRYMTMTKRYDTGVSWAWNLVITSFGFIGGTWGDPGPWGGWLFLWKREWSQQLE